MLLVFSLLVVLAHSSPYNWEAAEEVLRRAITNTSFPGATWAVLGPSGAVIGSGQVGKFTYGIPPPLDDGMVPDMKLDTLFDMASCTKVVAGTSAVALLYQEGHLALDTRVQDVLGPSFAQEGKGEITVRNCLLHNTGFPPDPTPYWYWYKQFGCPQSSMYHPTESFECRDKIYDSLAKQTLANPIGSKYVYSDLSFITLMWVAGTVVMQKGLVSASDLNQDCMSTSSAAHPSVAQCYYEAFVRTKVLHPLKMMSSGYLPPKASWPLAAPAENDTEYLHGTFQGQVSDRNTYSLGGISGHAGLFSNVPDLVLFMRHYMDPSAGVFLNASTVALFTREYNNSQSSRALGWNTNDPTTPDRGWDLLCGNMSATTYTHVGFTGTQLCGDPVRRMSTVFLTNRVYPSSANMKIEDVRRAFNKQIVRAFDAVHGPVEEEEEEEEEELL